MVVRVRLQRNAGRGILDASGVVGRNRHFGGAAHWHALAPMAVSNRCAVDRGRCRSRVGRDGHEIVFP